jgi:hypothetical protein
MSAGCATLPSAQGTTSETHCGVRPESGRWRDGLQTGATRRLRPTIPQFPPSSSLRAITWA